MSGDIAQNMLVSAPELARRLASGSCVVVDCRFDLSRPQAGEAAWRSGHIPGAHYAHLDRDLAAPRTPGSGRHPLPDPIALAQRVAGWGVDDDTLVVAYDDAGGAIAARLWWLLRWLGHPHAALLDGGWQAWLEAGYAPSSVEPVAKPGNFRGVAGQMPVIGAAGVAQGLASGRLLLLDARARARFRGEVEPIDPVAGHVPGAISRPFQENLDEAGRFRDPAAIGAALRLLLGARDVADVAVMCGSGVTACHDLFALELCGLAGAMLYPGSWSEWVADSRRPVERG